MLCEFHSKTLTYFNIFFYFFFFCKVGLLILFALFGFISGKCPDPKILNPCKCNENGIFCGGNDVFNLKHIFEAIDSELNDNEKHFKQFFLNNTAITELEENTFHNITFDQIYIFNATKLKLINTHAFIATNSVTKKFSVNWYSFKEVDSKALINSPPNYDIFLMLSSIISLEEIYLVYTNITQIPSHAFRSVNEIQKNLTTIWFNGSPIVTIGNYSFYDLNNLDELSFDLTLIDSIPSNALHFREDSNNKMRLYLQYMKLNESSFEIESLNNLKRPTDLLIGGSKLTYLDQNIFQPFLESNFENKIWFQGSGYFDCDDCRSFWLKKEPKYSNRTDLAVCSNGKVYSDSTNFAKCKE